LQFVQLFTETTVGRPVSMVALTAGKRGRVLPFGGEKA
jgi:hypothetical protein